MQNTQHTILFIDDDPDDQEMLREALESVEPETEVIEAKNGLDGIAKLKSMRHSDKGLPCMIVLDINMPRMDGRETFEFIKSDKDLSSIPLVIFSTSTSNTDKMFFNRKDVEYFPKPINSQEFAETAVRMLSICKH